MLGRRLVAIIVAVAIVSGTQTAFAAEPDGFFGVTATAYPSLSSEPPFQQLALGGVDRVRVVVYWPSVEPSPGVYQWQKLDSLAANGALTGTDLLPVLFGTPRWASGARMTAGQLELNRPPIYRAESRQAWSAFVGTLVRRYGSHGSFWAAHPELPKLPIRDWQIWNEVNLPFYWGGKPSPKRYARLVRLAHRAIVAADPKGRLVLAGLLPYRSLGGGIISDRFLRRMFRVHGIRKQFDVVAVHPYAAHPRAVLRLVKQTRRTLDALGARKTPLWATEFGWTTGGADLATSPFRSTQAQQAHKVRKTYRLLSRRSGRLKLGAAFYFSLADGAMGARGSWQSQMGLFALGQRPKRAWFAYARVAGGRP